MMALERTRRTLTIKIWCWKRYLLWLLIFIGGHANAEDICALEPVSISALEAISARRECLDHPYVSQLEGVRFWEASVRYSDIHRRSVKGKLRRNAVAEVRVVADFPNLNVLAETARLVDEHLPHGCSTASRGPIHAQATEDGALRVAARVTYHARTCTKVPCWAPWRKGPCWLKFDAAPPTDFEVSALITPKPITENLDGELEIRLDMNPSIRLIGERPRFGWQLLDASTQGMLANLRRSIARSRLDGIRAELIPKRLSVPGVPFPRIDKNYDVEDLKLQDSSFRVLMQSGQIAFEFTAKTPRLDDGLLCELRSGALQFAHFAEHCTREQHSVAVQPRDSLWRIAERAYGHGQYYQVLLAENPELRTKPLLVNSRIRIAPFYEIGRQGRFVIQHGDTLWALAKRELGAGSRYREFRKLGAAEPAHDSTIYSLEQFVPVTASTAAGTP